MLGFFSKKKARRRVFVLGLDCAAPELVFDRWREDLPNLASLADRGAWGELRSSTPCITVPAWSCMLSSKDPGTLGVYGFRNRSDHSYEDMFIATSEAIRHDRVWDHIGRADRSSVVIGVPGTYPVRPLKGAMISSFLTPSTTSPFTYPPELKQEVLRVAPDYAFDVRGFRTDDKAWLLDQIHRMTEDRFRVIDHLLGAREWDFFMAVEMGVDRIHHGFWSHMDPDHRNHVPGNEFENAIHDYYVRIDQKLGEWLGRLDDTTSVLVVSDHGAKRLEGGICINEWLWRSGYLAFEEDPEPGQRVRLSDLEIDWSRTRAWGEGGYYGRVFVNVEGREPRGVVPASEYDAFRDRLAGELAAIPGPGGEELDTRVYRPEELYREVNGVPPDLLVYFGNLFWRSVGSLGYDEIYTFENDTGPDDCNHAENGMVILYDPQAPAGGVRLEGAGLMDVAPTILELMGEEVPGDMQGRSLLPETAQVR